MWCVIVQRPLNQLALPSQGRHQVAVQNQQLSTAVHTDHWWPTALQQLEAHLPALVDDFLSRLTQLRGGYASIRASELRQTAHDTLSYLIARLADRPVPHNLADLPQRLGVRRARQGVDRDQLLAAVRLDYRVLWTGLISITDVVHAEELVQHAEPVLTLVEDYIHSVQVAFLDEREALASDSRSQETRAFALLLAAEDPASIAPAVASKLRFPVDATYDIVLVSTSAAAKARRIALTFERTRQRFVSWDFDDSVLFVRPMMPDPHPLTGISGVRLTTAQGLIEVPRVIDFAHQLLPFAIPGRLSDEQDLWLALASDSVTDAMPEVFSGALHAMQDIRPDERERLFHTFARFCSTGSVKQTAEQMFVHRNTVINRLQGFHRLTNLDPMVPVEAARALLAFGPDILAELSNAKNSRAA